VKLKGILGYCIILLAVPTLAAINRTVLLNPIPEKAITIIPDLVLAILFTKAFFRRYVRGDFRFTIPDLLAIIVFLYSAALSFPDLGNGILGFRISGARILLYFTIRLQYGTGETILDASNEWTRFISAIAKVLIAVGVLGYLIAWVLPEKAAQAWYTANGFVIGYYEGVRRMDSIFWSPVAFAAAMAFASLIFFDAFLKASRRGARLWALAAFLFVSSCNLLSMSRGAWVSEAVGVLVLLAMYKDKLRSLALVMLAIIVLGGLVSSSDSLKRQMASLLSTTEAGTGQIPRFDQRKEGLASILENPLGYGVGSSGYIGARKEGPIKAVTDNWYIKTTRELGIVGLMLYLALFAALIGSAAKTGSASIVGRQALYLAFVFGFLMEAYGSNVFDFDFMGGMFWIMTGYAMNIADSNSVEAFHA
jgi:hypothetical protein